MGCGKGTSLIYSLLLGMGLVGLVVLALLGFAHDATHHGHGALDGGTDHAHLHDAGTGHGHGAGEHHAPTHSEHGSGQAHAHTHTHTESRSGNGNGSNPLDAFLWLMPLLSPLNWFSWMVGAGAAGLIGRMAGLGEPLTAGVALGGAVLFHQGVVKPVWRLVFSFVSPPARNLDGCLLQTVEAVTGFNQRGEGLVRVVIDGRSEDLLARLTDQEQQRGVRVRRGDRLMIEEVDARTNSCRVFRA